MAYEVGIYSSLPFEVWYPSFWIFVCLLCWAALICCEMVLLPFPKLETKKNNNKKHTHTKKGKEKNDPHKQHTNK